MQLGDDWSSIIAVMTVDHTIAGGRPRTQTDRATLKRHRLLESAASKLQWVERNLATIADNVREFFGQPSNLAVLDADRDPESGEYVYRIAIQPPLDEFGE